MTAELADLDVNGRSGSWDSARDMFPSWQHSTEEWLEVFAARPEALTSLLGSIYRAGTVARQRREGTFTGQNGGRRVSGQNGNMDDLWGMVQPSYSMEPFPCALRALMGSMTVRRYAAQVPMAHQDLSKLMRGQIPLTMYRMERIALAGGVAPAYFLEWRTQKVCQIVSATLMAQPNLSVYAIKALERS